MTSLWEPWAPWGVALMQQYFEVEVKTTNEDNSLIDRWITSELYYSIDPIGICSARRSLPLGLGCTCAVFCTPFGSLKSLVWRFVDCQSHLNLFTGIQVSKLAGLLVSPFSKTVVSFSNCPSTQSRIETHLAPPRSWDFVEREQDQTAPAVETNRTDAEQSAISASERQWTRRESPE